jgi:hypothetical protein
MKIPIDLKEERERVEKLFAKKHRDGGFTDKTDFSDWFMGELKEKNKEYKCYYCETSINDIRKLIVKGLLKPRKIGHDKTRGPVLEIGRKDNDKGYTRDNCVLACYYCNNDKSSIFESEDYKKHFGSNRGKYLRNLLKKICL